MMGMAINTKLSKELKPYWNRPTSVISSQSRFSDYEALSKYASYYSLDEAKEKSKLRSNFYCQLAINLLVILYGVGIILLNFIS